MEGIDMRSSERLAWMATGFMAAALVFSLGLGQPTGTPTTQEEIRVKVLRIMREDGQCVAVLSGRDGESRLILGTGGNTSIISAGNSGASLSLHSGTDTVVAWADSKTSALCIGTAQQKSVTLGCQAGNESPVFTLTDQDGGTSLDFLGAKYGHVIKLRNDGAVKSENKIIEEAFGDEAIRKEAESNNNMWKQAGPGHEDKLLDPSNPAHRAEIKERLRKKYQSQEREYANEKAMREEWAREAERLHQENEHK
jgi:hypothetical protein